MDLLLTRRRLIAAGCTLPLLALPGCATKLGDLFNLEDAVRRLLTISSQRAFARLLTDEGFFADELTRVELPSQLGGSRIASTLARLSTTPAEVARPTDQPPALGDIPDVTADAVRTVIRARRLRSRYFEEGMFADPAWDMLLDLLQAEISQLRVPVSSLCIAASVPATTALRWLKMMTQQGIFLRRADPHDGRRVFVELAPSASQALRRYFADAGRPMVV